MFLRFLLCAAFLVGLEAQTLPRVSPTVQTNKQTLAAVLRWEILWNDSPRISNADWRVAHACGLLDARLRFLLQPPGWSLCEIQSGRLPELAGIVQQQMR